MIEKNIKMRIIKKINNDYNKLEIGLLIIGVMIFSWFVYNYTQRILKKKRDVISS